MERRARPGARQRIVRASEIGQYAYCARAWWLGVVQGVPSANQAELTAGSEAHHAHGYRVRDTVRLERAAYGFFAVAGLTAAALYVVLIAQR